jgi:hypothetical protein
VYKTLLGMVNGGFVPTESSSTRVHSNIDNFILQSELDKFIQTGWFSEDKTLEYIGGTGDVVANVAMSPLIAAKKIPSLLKAIKDMGLKNPLYHFTSAPRASGIMKSGIITGSGRAFPGKPFKGEKVISGDVLDTGISYKMQSPAVSVTRDPKFTSRPHKHVGTDVRFIMDRDEMIKKGLKIEPFAEKGFGKVHRTWDKDKFIRMNPMFEFEERVRGNIPTENIKLIDLLKFPKYPYEETGAGIALSGQTLLNRADFLHDILKKKIPIMMSEEARSSIKQLGGKDILTSKELKELMKAPTYKFDPFKRRKSTP